MMRAKGRVSSAKERLIKGARGAAASSPPPTLDAAHGLANVAGKEWVLRRALAALRRPEHGLTGSGRDGGGSRRSIRGKEMRSPPPFGPASQPDRPAQFAA